MSQEVAFEVGRLYAPVRAIADIIVAGHGAIFHELPALEGYYPMGMTDDDSGKATNHTGGANPLTQVGVVPVAFDGKAYRHLGDGTNYLSATGAYGMTGLETFVSSSIRGFTLGGWFMIDSLPGTADGLISRDGISPQRGYNLLYKSTGAFRFGMSGNGAAVFGVDSPSFPISVWTFAVGRFTPSTEIAVIVNGDKSILDVAIPASCNVSTQAFEVGRWGALDANIVHAKARDLFVCRSALSDEQIETLRQSSMPSA